jgi:phosphoribosylformylglycinamidine (FGAM) synthase-like amidotransferase family enzyme
MTRNYKRGEYVVQEGQASATLYQARCVLACGGFVFTNVVQEGQASATLYQVNFWDDTFWRHSVFRWRWDSKQTGPK